MGSALSSSIGEVLNQKVDGGLPGAFVFVECQDGVTEFITSGVADLASGEPMTPEHRYRVGSTTKAFTATVVLQLVAEERLDLSQLVAHWFHDRPIPGGDVLTVEHLLRMRSGLFDFVDHSSLAGLESNRTPHTLDEVIDLGLEGEANLRPGERFSYCNTNFCLLERIVEEVTGYSLAEELAKRVFEPLDLAGTTYPPEDDLSLPEPYIRGYNAGDSGWQECSEVFFGRGDGAILSTAMDLAKFFRALLGGTLLPEGLLNEMRSVISDRPPAEYLYGLGLIAEPLSTGTVWGHSGRGFGYRHHPFLDPTSGRFAIWMLNGTSGFPTETEGLKSLLNFSPGTRALAYQ